MADQEKRNLDFSKVRVGDIIRINQYTFDYFHGKVAEILSSDTLRINWFGSSAQRNQTGTYHSGRFAANGNDFWSVPSRKTLILIKR